MSSVRLEVKILDGRGVIPRRVRDTDCGYDIYASERVVLRSGASTMVHTGIAVAAPAGYYFTIDGRSSLWVRGIIVNRGIIDSTYTGELIVSLMNTSGRDYTVMEGDRIAQLIIHKQHDALFDVVDEFSADYNIRGANGFGSTGR